MGEGHERGPFAEDPAEFAECGTVLEADHGLPSTPFSMTNLGLQICLPLLPIPMSGYTDTYIAVLNCRVPHLSAPLGIYVKREKSTGDQFSRIEPNAVLLGENDDWAIAKSETLFVKNRPSPPKIDPVLAMERSRERFEFSIRKVPLHGGGFVFHHLGADDDSRDDGKRLWITLRSQNSFRPILMKSQDELGGSFIVAVGVCNHRIYCDVRTHPSKETTFESIWRDYENMSHAEKTNSSRISGTVSTNLSRSLEECQLPSGKSF